MRTRSLLLAAVCVLILTSTFDCKKPTKEIKNKKTKEIKQQKGKITEAEKVKAEPVKVEKLKVEKPKTEKVKVAEVEEVQKTAHEELTKSDAVHTNVFESPLETAVNNHQSDTIKPKSLKALTAYDQCKIECRKQRDHIIAQEVGTEEVYTFPTLNHSPLLVPSPMSQIIIDKTAPNQSVNKESFGFLREKTTSARKQ
uniref:Secreted protein n=1 Tax=Heterorhabditis bacteriophora TaxID=37862 RepID=A0A1I7XQ01_HETBA